MQPGTAWIVTGIIDKTITKLGNQAAAYAILLEEIGEDYGVIAIVDSPI